MWRSLLRNRYVIVLLLIQAIFLWPFFRQGIFHSHDGVLHIARIAAYFQALHDGQFPVRWAGNLNFDYGTPLFIFYYPLPYLVGSLLHQLNLNFTTVFKLLLATSFLAAPLCFYFWIRKLVSPIPAAAASIIYGLAPYHFLDLYVRGDIGELFSFAFIPLVLLSIEEIRDNPKPRSVIWGSICYALLILSHNAFALLFSPIFLFYTALRYKKKASWKAFTFMIVLGLGLSAFFWLPALAEQKYTHANLFIGSKYKENFPTITQLVWSPWGFGTEVGKPEGLSPQIGPIGLFIVALAIALHKKLQSQGKLFLFGIMLFALGAFLSLPYSIPIWNHMQTLQKFEFPWRFTALSSFAVAVMAALLFSLPKMRQTMIVLLAVTLLVSISLVRTGPDETKQDSFYLSYPSSTEFGAASTIWSAGDPSKYPEEPVKIVGGTGSISNYTRRSTAHAFTITAQDETTVLDNTLYFPGWRVLVDTQKIPIEFQDANYRGLITFQVPQGTHKIIVRFTESPIRFFSNVISAIFSI